jgi:predicted O-methyltransferase YrrM
MKSPLGRLNPPCGPHYQDKLAVLIHSEKPKIVIETGLETGFGAEYILEALDHNGQGHLWSIDPVIHKDFADHPINHPRFTFIQMLSEDALEPLFDQIGPFDMFIHDSDHDFHCQDFEYEAAWKFVRLGGIIVSDDPFWGQPPHLAWDKFLHRHGVTSRHIIGNAQWIRKDA